MLPGSVAQLYTAARLASQTTKPTDHSGQPRPRTLFVDTPRRRHTVMRFPAELTRAGHGPLTDRAYGWNDEK
jgi:hypothetical protein